MTVPVTTGGKKRMIFAKNGAMKNPIILAAMIAPKTSSRPPPPARIASIVATAVKETPWINGSRDPRKGKPADCKIVATPPTNRLAVTSFAVSSADRPAAPLMISGTAKMPPYMVNTCCRPNAKVLPNGKRSFSGALGFAAYAGLEKRDFTIPRFVVNRNHKPMFSLYENYFPKIDTKCSLHHTTVVKRLPVDLGKATLFLRATRISRILESGH